MQWTSRSPEETQALGQRVVKEFPQATLLCLRGPLGSGKTCFVKGVGEALGIPGTQIKSPTFTTLMEHGGERPLLHLDFYRFEAPDDLALDWWRELLETPNALTVVEWAERVEPHLPIERVDIEFIDGGGNKRLLVIKKGS